jgi:TatD DNase family protein
VNFVAYDSDREDVVARALAEKVWMINVGTQQDTSQDAIHLAEKYPEGVYAIIGLHPVHTDKSFHDVKELGEGGKEFTSRGEHFDHDFYLKLAAHPKVVAIGECGLDYFHLDADTKLRQKDIFEKHVRLAQEIGKPLMLHIRNGKDAGANAYADALEILKKYPKVTGDVHFFAGTVQEALAFIALGFSISFTGVITFTHDYDEVVRAIPLDKIMSETDCPYITPVPFRGKRNEPLHVREVVKKIAEIKRLDFETVRKQLVENARKMFKI